MDISAIVEKAQELNDNELAILLCLMANQHCILTTDPDALDSLSEEVELVGNMALYLCLTTEVLNRFLQMYLASHTQSFTAANPQHLIISEMVF